ncbi:hypothetical protein DFH29DRAFT_1072740 [Suillus ampliporus]|nr:hypothetical protein DFH29DRAFT_1072740 [Suillus ampliporus]
MDYVVPKDEVHMTSLEASDECKPPNDVIYVWYFDRQDVVVGDPPLEGWSSTRSSPHPCLLLLGLWASSDSTLSNVIQCSGINFVQDLPRFMVLLLIMQRIKYKQWGLNMKFEPTPIPVEKNGMDVDLKLDLKSDERTTHSVCADVQPPSFQWIVGRYRV